TNATVAPRRRKTKTQRRRERRERASEEVTIRDSAVVQEQMPAQAPIPVNGRELPLAIPPPRLHAARLPTAEGTAALAAPRHAPDRLVVFPLAVIAAGAALTLLISRIVGAPFGIEIGRASCRERVWASVVEGLVKG